MPTMQNLNAVVEDVRALCALAVDHIQNLSHSLAYAQAQAADAAALEQIATELQASADQLRGALAAVAQIKTQA